MRIALGLGKRSRASRRRARVALVGREQAGSENLSLRYLAGALVEAGHAPLIVPVAGPASLEDAAARIEKYRPEVVGLSMPDSDATIDALAFVAYLRARGYDGHVTCGGPLATLVRHELLDGHPGIDSVVRHDGEVPLTELAFRVAAGEPWHDIPGISMRGGDGPPADVTDPTPMHTRPVHADPLPRLIGVPTARLATSRGCPGRCPYCGPAALQREAVREGKLAGHGRKALSDAGVGGTRYRHASDVAEEVAALYHAQGARSFQIIDENLLSGTAERSESWLRTLIAELRRREVGRVAFCLQADPVTLTTAVVELLDELGVIRVSVGIEGLTSPQRRALGRTGETDEHLDLLGRLVDHGIVANFNSLIVHPESTADAIGRELDALERLRPVHFDVQSMAVYPGTRAHQMLLDEGRVTGGMLAMRFEPKDIVVKRFRAALIRMRLEALGRYAPNIFAHDVAINVALARRLALPTYDVSMEGEIESALADLNRVRVAALQTVLALCRAEMPLSEREFAMASILASLGRDVAPAVERIARVQRRLEARADGKVTRSNLMIASAMATGFFLTLATPGCGGTVEDETGSQGERPREAAGGEASGGVGGSAGASSDGTSAGGTTGTGGTSPGPEVPPIPSVDAAAPCSAEQKAELRRLLAELAGACRVDRRCSHVDVYDEDAGYGDRIVIDSEGNFVSLLRYDGTELPPETRRCYADALGGQTFPCLSGEDIWYECVTILL